MTSPLPGIPPAPHIDGAEHLHSGKVRDLYRLPDGRLLMVASDRISAYDFVLDSTIPDKGVVLTQMSLWWFDQLADLVPNHVVSTDVPDVREGPRGRLREPRHVRRRVRGARLPHRLRAGRLPRHRRGLRHRAARRARGRQPPARADLHPRHEGRGRRPRRERLVRRRRRRRSATRPPPGCATSRSRSTPGPRGSPASAGSSWPTPSSSSAGAPTARWCSATRCSPRTRRASGRPTSGSPAAPQPSYDKQIVRDWLTSPASGWDKASGEQPPPLPAEVVERTRSRYIEAYELLTGQTF